MTQPELLQQALESTDEILFAFLFGSRARGNARPNSDWDVGVYLEDGLDARTRFRVRLRLLADLDALGRVDVVVLNDAPPLLAQQALAGERLLVRDETALVRFTVRTLSMAEDDRYFSRIHFRERVKRLEEGRFGRPQRI